MKTLLYQNSNEAVSAFKEEFYLTSEFKQMALDKLAELMEEPPEEPIQKLKLYHNDKEKIAYLKEHIEIMQREAYNLAETIDEKYRLYVNLKGDKKEWMLWSIENRKKEQEELRKTIRTCEVKILISTGKYKAKPLDIPRAKAVPIGDLMKEPGSGTKTRMKYCCPLHEEDTPSFVWYVRENRAKCFGCNWWGDAIDLYKALNNVDFKTAVLTLNQY